MEAGRLSLWQLFRKEVMVGLCMVAAEMARGEYPLEVAVFCVLTAVLSNTGESV